MISQSATIESPDKVPLSKEVQEALGLRAGSGIEITIEEGKVTLQPLEDDGRSRLSEAGTRRAIGELRGMFRGQPSLEDDLHKMRQEEEDHSQRKYRQ